MKKTKWLRGIVIGVVVLLVVAVAGAWLMIDRLAKGAVEQGGQYALGVPTTVESLNLSLLGGSLKMDGLTVANPSGFKTAHLVRTGQFNLAVQPGSVLSDTVVVPTFELTGLDLNIESKGLKSNIETVMDHIKTLGGSSGQSSQAKPAEPAPRDEGKKVVVNRLVIRDVVAHVTLPLPGAEPLAVKVPAIELKDIGSDKPIDIPELIGRLMPAILAAVLEQGKGIIPSDMLASLQGNLQGTVAALGGQATQLVQQAAGAVTAQMGNVVQQVQGVVPAVAQGAVQKAADGAQSALQSVQQAAAGSVGQAISGATSQPADQKGGGGLGKSLGGLLKKDK